MGWNEPGGGGKDPWGSRGGDQGPPDLDELVRKFQQKLGGLFGGKGGASGPGGPSIPGKPAKFGLGLVAAVAVVVYVLLGVYIVDPAERGVVQRFGRYVATTGPGPHWRAPLIETKTIVDVDQIRTVSHKALMLTQDENIVSIDLAVQYRVKDARDYLFNVRDPDLTLKEAVESAVREAIGKSKMDFVLTEGRSEIVARTETLIQEMLDRYGTGLQLTSVNLQDAQPPEAVQGAFADAIKAREDEQRLKNEAEAYANEVIPVARGTAARQLEEANGHKEQVIAKAEGDTSRFLQLLTEYRKAPEVTRQRLYLDALEGVLANTNKVVMDVEKGGNSLIYLPLDKLLERAAGPAAGASGAAPSGQRPLESAPLSTDLGDPRRDRENLRMRGTR